MLLERQIQKFNSPPFPDSIIVANHQQIILKSLLNCIDNSGARIVECVNVLKKKPWAAVGDEIVVVVKKTRNLPTGVQSSGPSATTNVTKVKKGEVSRAVVVRTRSSIRRKDGTIVKFEDNACVLVNKQQQPVGNRVLGIVAQEVRDKNWTKIATLAPKLV